MKAYQVVLVAAQVLRKEDGDLTSRPESEKEHWCERLVEELHEFIECRVTSKNYQFNATCELIDVAGCLVAAKLTAVPKSAMALLSKQLIVTRSEVEKLTSLKVALRRSNVA